MAATATADAPPYLSPGQGRLLQAGEPAPTPYGQPEPRSTTPPQTTPVVPVAPAQPSPLPEPTPQAKVPAKAPEEDPAYPGSIPSEEKEEPKQKDEASYPGSIPAYDPELKAKAEAFKKQQQLGQGAGAQPGTGQPKELGKPPTEKGYEGSIPVEGPYAQPQPPVTPPVTAAGPQIQPPVTQPPQPATYLTIAQDQPDTQEQIQALVSQGYSPGAAQAIVAGQQPKTISGEAPAPPKPEPSPPSPATPESMEDAQKRYEAERTRLGVEQPAQPLQQPAPEVQKPESGVIGGNRIKGTSTIFGLTYKRGIDPDDNGRGIFGANTRDPSLKGAAVPVDILTKTFGQFVESDGRGGYNLLNTPEAKKVIQAIRSAHVELPGADGKMHSYPIVDIQGTLAGHPGKVLDLTYGATKELGFTDNHDVSYQIIGGDGKPYPISAEGLVSQGGKGPTGFAWPQGGVFAGQPLFSIGSAGGGGGTQPPQQAPQGFVGGGGDGGGAPASAPAGGGNVNIGGGLGSFLAGVAIAGRRQAQPSGQAAPEQAAPPAAAPPEEDPMVTALMNRGFTRQQALNFAQSSQTVAPGKGVGPLQPPAAPGAAPQLPPPSGTTIKFPSAKQLMPGKVPKIVPPPGKQPLRLPPPAAPGAAVAKTSTAAAPAPKAPATTAPPAKAPTLAAPVTPAEEARAETRPPTSYTGAPRGSTHGIAHPPSFAGLTPGLKLAHAVREHAGLLSEDDPRVKKQADGMIKGEHFVSGDPIHDQLLAGLPEGHSGPQRQMLGEAEQAIAEKRPMHISYLSAPKEAAKFPTRESRTVQYDAHTPEARLMGDTVGQLVGHSFVPTSVGVKLPTKAGEPHQSYIQGISTNVLANNFQHLNEKLATMGRETPYKSLGAKFSNDLEGYLANLNAGHTATGRGYFVGTEDHPNEPDTSHVPYKLSRKETDFINTVINNTAAFAKHEDAQKLRELASANGTLITPKGETNRMRHDIEEHEPGWRQRVLEPSIRSFKTGLIVAHHKDEQYMPHTIRPGKGYQDLTRAMARTSERGRPDVPVATSLHHTFVDNRAINNIERDFSEHRIDEAEARNRLKAMGEEPDEFRFVGGSGGLITPYEDDPESITPEEHSSMKDNLRKQWVGGKMGVDDYRKKVAEVPLPAKPSSPTSAPVSAPAESVEQPVERPNLIRAQRQPEPVAVEPGESPAPTAPPKVKKKPEGAPEAPKHEPERVTAAATRFSTGAMYTGATHHEAWMKGIDEGHPTTGEENGFLTNRDRFIDRDEAWRIAKAAKQVSGQKGFLRGEDIPEEDLQSDTPEEEGLTWTKVKKKPAVAPEASALSLPKEPAIKAEAPAAPTEAAQAPIQAQHVFKKASPEDFIAHRNRSGQASGKSGFLSELKPEEIAQHKLFTNQDHSAGVAVSPEGDVQNVFGRKGSGAHAVVHAIKNGGKTLDAYDGFLPEYYRQFGFKETGRMKFNPEFAHNWDPKEGKPDVVFMAHAGYPEGGEKAALERASTKDRSKRIPNERSEQSDDDWDTQKQRSLRAFGGGEGAYRAPGVEQEPETDSGGSKALPPTGARGGRAVEPPPAPDQPLPATEAPEKLTKPKGWEDRMKNPRFEKQRQAYLEKRVAATLERQNKHSSAIPLKVQRNEKGGVQYDPQLNPVWQKTDYNLADTPFLQKKGKGLSALGAEGDKHEDTLGKDEHKHLNQVERRRASALRSQSAVETLGDQIFESYNKIKDQPDIAAGKGWYSRMRDKMRKVFGEGEGGKASEDHELFAQLLGATSAKTPVRENFMQALDAFEQYKAGKFDRHIKLYNEAYQAMQDGGYKALNELMHERGMFKPGDDIPDTDAKAMAHWIGHHGIMPVRQNGEKFNSNSEQVLKVLAKHWLDDVKAPKTPNFAGNLTGRTMAATIDVWAARHLHRLGHEHEGEKAGWRPQAAAEPGVNSLDFAFAQDAMAHAAKKIGINPDDLQAILWYAEKHHYDQHGWTGTTGAEKGSFDETWDKAFPTEGKAMTSQELRGHYQAEAKKDKRLEAIQEAVAGKQAAGKSEEHIDKYLTQHADPFLQQHGYTREHVLGPPPAAPGAVHMRQGGFVPGNGNRDTVPAMLTPGEYVVPKKDASKLARAGVLPPPPAPGGVVHMQQGGPVPSDVEEEGLDVYPTPPAVHVQRAEPAPGTAFGYPGVEQGLNVTGSQTPPKYQTSGWGTMFGDPKDPPRYWNAYNAAIKAGKTPKEADEAGKEVGDTGIGSPALGTISSPNSYGVAIPHDTMIQHFGTDPAAYRTARALITINGHDVQVPIVDFGPGKKTGAITDVTYPLAQAVGMGDGAKVSLRLVGNAGPDYMTNQNDWWDEQSRIGSQLNQGTLGGMAGTIKKSDLLAPTPAVP